MFRSRHASRLLVLLLLCAAEASAGSRISLLPFEGDRPKPLRWRVAYVLKRAGHVVLGYAPPADRSSVSSLRDYADRRNVDVFVSGISAETPQGWELSLRFRGADGKTMARPLRFRADNLRGLLIALKSEGPSKLDGAVSGSSPAAGPELPPGRALPLPTRRARAPKPASDRPVLPGGGLPGGGLPGAGLPGGGPEGGPEEPAAEAARSSPAEVDLDAPAKGDAQTWDADSDDPPSPKARLRAKQDPATARAAKQRTALQRLALGGTSPKRGDSSQGIDLDADTRGALEESPKSKSRPVLDDPADPASDSPPEPSSDSGELAAAQAPEVESMDEPSAEPEPRPKKKGLFAGRLRRSNKSGDAGTEAGGESGVADRGSDEDERAARAGALAVLGAHAGYLHRSLAYSDDLYRRLRALTTNGWVYRLDASLYPFAQPLKDRFSLIASYEGAIAGTVRDSRANRDFGVKFSDIEAGLRFRQPFAAHEIGVQATVGQLTAGLDASSSVTEVPEISYLALSPRVDLSLNFGPVSLRGGLGYQRSLGSFGEIAQADWFPHLSGYGFDGQLGVDYRFSPTVTFQTGGVLRRFVLDMNSRPEDAIGGRAEVAGGAVDQYVSGYFGLQFTL